MATYNAIKYNVDYAGKAGSLVPISDTTISSDSNVVLTIDGTYDEHFIIFNAVHPASSNENFGVNFRSTGSSGNFDVGKQTGFYRCTQEENGSGHTFAYQSGKDLAGNSSSDQEIGSSLGNSAHDSISGYMSIFNAGSTTFQKSFFIVADETHGGNIQIMSFVSGYVRTTDALTGIRFQMSSGNLDSGSIQLFGVHR
tara:strand:+ start:11 stop:601 length:591 start_codon:yes stop_codon:yes gene_type:complete